MEKIAIISTRLGGVDGVSIEANKWAQAFNKLNIEPILIAGSFIKKQSYTHYVIKELDFNHPEIEEIRNKLVNIEINKIEELKNIIKQKIEYIIKKENINYFSIENALSLPLNIPLAIALTELIIENNVKTITRHHDFFWERREFLNINNSKINDILNNYFPPGYKTISHVVINSIAKESLFNKKAILAYLIPNVFDFKITKYPEYQDDNKIKQIKSFLGITQEELLFLQPTRIIRRKNIERTIDLIEKLSFEYNLKIKLIISGIYEKFEMDYFYELIEYSAKKRVNLILCNSFDHKNKKYPNIKIIKFFKYFDIYSLFCACDLVTLPSDIEGFGNPVLEAAAFKKPLFVNNYPVLKDFLEKDFDFIVFDKVIKADTTNKIFKVLTDTSYRKKMVDKNYKIAKKYYSFETLLENLKNIIFSKIVNNTKILTH